MLTAAEESHVPRGGTHGRVTGARGHGRSGGEQNGERTDPGDETNSWKAVSGENKRLERKSRARLGQRCKTSGTMRDGSRENGVRQESSRASQGGHHGGTHSSKIRKLKEVTADNRATKELTEATKRNRKINLRSRKLENSEVTQKLLDPALTAKRRVCKD